MDVVSPQVRSRIMASIRSRDTTPERAVRSTAHRLGLRFRLHDRKLPGTPDLVFAKHRTVVFVQGCFWHQHTCSLGKVPKSRPEYWGPKFTAIKARDLQSSAKLGEAGWKVVEVWECETRRPDCLRKMIIDAFGLAPE